MVQAVLPRQWEAQGAVDNMTRAQEVEADMERLVQAVARADLPELQIHPVTGVEELPITQVVEVEVVMVMKIWIN